MHDKGRRGPPEKRGGHGRGRGRADRPPGLPKEEGERILAEIRKALEEGGFAIIQARAHPERRIRLVIERASGEPVTLGDCERANRAAEFAMRAIGVDPGDFEFAVESPGADRPLTRDADFERFKEQQVTVTLREPREGRRNFTGRLVAGKAAGDVTVHVLDESEPQTFPAAEIREVRLHPEVKYRPPEPPKRR